MEGTERRRYVNNSSPFAWQFHHRFSNLQRWYNLRFLHGHQRLRRAISDDVTTFDFKCVAETRNVAWTGSAQPDVVWAKEKINGDIYTDSLRDLHSDDKRKDETITAIIALNLLAQYKDQIN